MAANITIKLYVFWLYQVLSNRLRMIKTGVLMFRSLKELSHCEAMHIYIFITCIQASHKHQIMAQV